MTFFDCDFYQNKLKIALKALQENLHPNYEGNVEIENGKVVLEFRRTDTDECNYRIEQNDIPKFIETIQGFSAQNLFANLWAKRRYSI